MGDALLCDRHNCAPSRAVKKAGLPLIEDPGTVSARHESAEHGNGTVLPVAPARLGLKISAEKGHFSSPEPNLVISHVSIKRAFDLIR